MDKNYEQMEIFSLKPDVVHYFDRNGALHSGRFVRIISKGKKKGQIVVQAPNGRKFIPYKVRNVEYKK